MPTILNSRPNYEDLTGRRFGMLVVTGYSHRTPDRRHYWHCRCDCGNLTTTEGTQLRRKARPTHCCGCDRRSVKTHRMSSAPEYSAWRDMVRRCENPEHKSYATYGGRGIRVCPEWMESFENFFADVGPRPSPKHSLDRHPNGDGNYEPGNVRWATREQQSNNTRRNRRLTVGGVTRTLAEWVRLRGLGYATVQSRLRSGWTIERALGLV